MITESPRPNSAGPATVITHSTPRWAAAVRARPLRLDPPRGLRPRLSVVYATVCALALIAAGCSDSVDAPHDAGDVDATDDVDAGDAGDAGDTSEDTTLDMTPGDVDADSDPADADDADDATDADVSETSEEVGETCALFECPEHSRCEESSTGPECVCFAGYQSTTDGQCQRDERAWSEGVEGSAEVSDSVELVTEAQLGALVLGDGTIGVSAADAPPDWLERPVPFVLISGHEEGWMRWVVAVERDGDTIALSTEPATLADVFQDADLSISLTPPDREPITGERSKSESSPWIDVDLAGRVLFDGEVSDTRVRVVIEQGWVRFDPELRLDYRTRFGSVRHLTFGLRGEVSAGLALRIELEDGVSILAPTLTLPLFRAPFTVLIAGVPVQLTPYVELEVGLDEMRITGCGSFSAGATFSSAVEGLVTYEAGVGWSTDETSGFDTSMLGPTFDVRVGGGEVTAAARVQLGVDVYGVAGPWFRFGPWARFGYEYTSPWQLEVGVDAAIGVRASAFGWDLVDYSHDVFDHGEVLATGPPKCDTDALYWCPSYYSGLDATHECTPLHRNQPLAIARCVGERKAPFTLSIRDCLLDAGCPTRVGFQSVQMLECTAQCWTDYVGCIDSYAGPADCQSCEDQHVWDCGVEFRCDGTGSHCGGSYCSWYSLP